MHSEVLSSIAHANTFLNTDCCKYCYSTLTIDLTSVIYLHTVKLLNISIRSIDGTLTGTTTPGQGRLGIMVMKGNPHSPKLHDWRLSFRWFSVISRTLVGGGSYFSAEMLLAYSTDPTDWVDLYSIAADVLTFFFLAFY